MTINFHLTYKLNNEYQEYIRNNVEWDIRERSNTLLLNTTLSEQTSSIINDIKHRRFDDESLDFNHNQDAIYEKLCGNVIYEVKIKFKNVGFNGYFSENLSKEILNDVIEFLHNSVIINVWRGLQLANIVSINDPTNDSKLDNAYKILEKEIV